MSYCDDCGCKKYSGVCSNCHEEICIEQQYIDLKMDVPESIQDKADIQREEINRKNYINRSF